MPSSPASPQSSGQSSGQTLGLGLALISYTVWALYPFYWILVLQVPVDQLLAHRMIWSMLFVVLLLPIIDGLRPLWQIICTPHMLLKMLFCSLLIGANWSIYIYSISIDKVIEASLGYYISPLFAALAAMVFLGERLRGLQYYALVLVCAGIVVAFVMYGHVPWLGLGLATTFALYSALRRHIKVASLTALAIEVFFPAVIGLIYLSQRQGGYMMDENLSLWMLVAVGGPITVIPLLLYGWAVNRAPLLPVALFFYVVPTGLFIIATFFFDEPFTVANIIVFVCVWAGIGLYVAQMIRDAKSR